MIVLAIVMVMVVMAVATPMWVEANLAARADARVVAEQIEIYHAASSKRCAPDCPVGPVEPGGSLPNHYRDAGNLRLGTKYGAMGSYRTTEGYLVTYLVPDDPTEGGVPNFLEPLSDRGGRFHYGRVGPGGVVAVRRATLTYTANGVPSGGGRPATTTLVDVDVGAVPGVPEGTPVVASEVGL